MRRALASTGVLLLLSAVTASITEHACDHGCSGDSMASGVCGDDGRTYQNECIARCQGVHVVALRRCAEDAGYIGHMLQSRAVHIEQQQIERFKDEGFKLLGHGKARAFNPATSSRKAAKKAARKSRSAKAEAAQQYTSRYVQAVRYTADGLVYIASTEPDLDSAAAGGGDGGSSTLLEAAGRRGANATNSSEGYIPPGWPFLRNTTGDNAPCRRNATTPNVTGGPMRRLRYVFGADDRQEINCTARYPYSAIGILTLEDPSGAQAYQCSGSMVSARSVLTAGHCVFDRDTNAWQQGWEFSANMYGGGETPFGTARWAYVTTFTGWVDPAIKNPFPYDMAVVQLANEGASLGNVTGWLGLEYVPSFDGTLDTAGYPGDEPPGTYWYTNCTVRDTNGADGQIKNFCDSYNGQSGSPMFVMRDGGRTFVHGVVSYGASSDTDTPLYNVACEVTARNFQKLLEWR